MHDLLNCIAAPTKRKAGCGPSDNARAGTKDTVNRTRVLRIQKPWFAIEGFVKEGKSQISELLCECLPGNQRNQLQVPIQAIEDFFASFSRIRNRDNA
jgi:hypothetical protein